jgi:hypothetical protein
MSSLTPKHRADEAVSDAAYEGLFNGFVVLVPSIGALALALQRYPGFRMRTNWQSRTAITIMPAMFVAALTSELKLSHKMKEIAQETQHSTETVKWAEEQWKQQKQQQLQQQEQASSSTSTMTESQHLTALYQQSVASTGVSVVPELHWYHKTANFTAQNPFKVLAAFAVPTVGYIFYGRSHQSHLQFSSMIMHTRVLGQSATIALLLGVMGFKQFMDTNVGRYISQQQADDRVFEMQMVRQQLLHRLEEEKQHAADLKQALVEAHEQDVQEHNTHSGSSKGKIKKKKPKKVEHEHEESVALDAIATSASSSSE